MMIGSILTSRMMIVVMKTLISYRNIVNMMTTTINIVVTKTEVVPTWCAFVNLFGR